MTEEQKLLAMLQNSGINLEGLTSMAYGGPVQYKANGFGITNVLDPEALKRMEEIKAMIAQMSGRPPKAGPRPDSGVDFESGVIKPKSLEDIMENQIVNNDTTRTEILAANDPDYNQDVGDSTMLEQLQYYADENPELFTAGVGALSKVINASLLDVPERKGNIVSTQTLPGNASRRRNNLSNITPIGGSKVTYANQGQALKRPMFMPQGGQMRGPGGPKDDLIPVMASNGEYMLSKAAVDAAGNGSHAQGLARLDAFNKMGNKRYG
jgi:hypothetical protein